MTTTPGADERRIRYALHKRGLGYAPQPPAAPASGDEWWDRLYEDADDHHGAATPRRRRIPPLRRPAAPKAEPEPAEQPEADPEWETAEPVDESTPAAVARDRRSPGRRLNAEYASLPHRTRVLLYNGTTAGTGYTLGIVHLFTSWITGAQNDTGSIAAALIIGTGLVITLGVLVDRRTRPWWGPLPWLCRIPLASAVLALALYAPASA